MLEKQIKISYGNCYIFILILSTLTLLGGGPGLALAHVYQKRRAKMKQDKAIMIEMQPIKNEKKIDCMRNGNEKNTFIDPRTLCTPFNAAKLTRKK